MIEYYVGDVFIPVDESEEWRKKLTEKKMEVGEYDYKENSFTNCRIKIDDFHLIDNLWGTIFWNLYPQHQEE